MNSYDPYPPLKPAVRDSGQRRGPDRVKYGVSVDKRKTRTTRILTPECVRADSSGSPHPRHRGGASHRKNHYFSTSPRISRDTGQRAARRQHSPHRTDPHRTRVYSRTSRRDASTAVKTRCMHTAHCRGPRHRGSSLARLCACLLTLRHHGNREARGPRTFRTEPNDSSS